VEAGHVLPHDDDYWQTASRLLPILELRPVAVICGTSHIAYLLYARAQEAVERAQHSASVKGAPPRMRPFLPALACLDRAGLRPGLPIGHANYRPEEMNRAVFTRLRDIQEGVTFQRDTETILDAGGLLYEMEKVDACLKHIHDEHMSGKLAW